MMGIFGKQEIQEEVLATEALKMACLQRIRYV